MEKLPRIFFDTNEGWHETGYILRLPCSKVDLSALGSNHLEGMLVTIYMPNELEMDARLHWDKSLGDWLARPVKGSIRYLTARD
ncbi:hypothetical protein [Sphingosinicella microcystinivorans]|nr:hypothetical protein [Sphingosinicella microcystinivorans]